jgi:Poly(ADP-ribose) polymerase catalytic domain.
MTSYEHLPKLLPRPTRPLSRFFDSSLYLVETTDELPSYSNEYAEVKRKIQRNLEGVNIKRIVKVHNPYLKGCYMLKKLECGVGHTVQEMELFHATGEDNIQNSIIKDNLNWRRAARVMYGHGVSFADDPGYANAYSGANHRSGYTSSRAMILAKVVVGNCINMCGCVLPPKGYDTTTGRNTVYVKYYDHEFYPEYVAYYTV